MIRTLNSFRKSINGDRPSNNLWWARRRISKGIVCIGENLQRHNLGTRRRSVCAAGAKGSLYFKAFLGTRRKIGHWTTHGCMLYVGGWRGGEGNPKSLRWRSCWAWMLKKHGLSLLTVSWLPALKPACLLRMVEPCCKSSREISIQLSIVQTHT